MKVSFEKDKEDSKKVKLFDYDNFINTSCTVLKSSVSDSININVQLFNTIMVVRPRAKILARAKIGG